MSVEFAVVVEFSIDGAWVDVTGLDGSTYVVGAITITRGRARQGERAAPTQITFRMRDDNCQIDGENPASPYYRKIAQGTQVRVSVDGDLRAVGEIATIDQIPGDTPNVNFVDIVAAGVLRRLDIPQRPLNSAAYDAFSSPENDSTRIFYAPLEEEEGATKIATFGGRGSVADDQPVTLGGDTDTKSSARLVSFGTNGKLEVEIPVYTSNEHKICMLWKFPEGGLTNGHVPVRLHCTGGNIDRIHLRYNTPWTLILDAMRGFTIADSAVNVDWTGYIDNNQEFYLSIELTQNGSDVDCLVGIIREDGTFGVPTDTLTGVTIGRIYHITIGANDIDGSSFGQLIVGNDTAAFGNYIRHVSNTANGVNGYASEVADTRMFRLLSAQNVTFGVTQATLNDAVEMGPQRTGQLGDLVYDCVDADDGILIEHKLFLALVYATRFSLYNKAPLARLTWEQLSAPFKPVVNDVDLYNDFQVTRPGGTSERYVIPDGDWQHWTTEEPPDGVGPRPGEAELNLWPDSEVGNHAAWRAHINSWREKRFDQVTVHLTRLTEGERSDIRFLDPGDVIAIDTTNAPAYVYYNEIRLLIQGYTETITPFTHDIVFNTTPADIYEVAQVDADGSVLAAPITAGTTSIKIAPPSKGPEWTEDFGDLPYHIQVAGQPMTVTAISTDTPAFIAASATVASGVNAGVTPALPAGITADVGQLLIIFASVRNSGTGTVDTPTGWTELVDFGNTSVFAKYYETGDTAPLVTFSGSVAGADTLARMAAFSGLSMVPASGTKGTPGAHTQLNSSAANVAYPAMTLPRPDGAVGLMFAWKQDDSTGVTPPAGFTEWSDDTSTAGDDAHIWAAYDLTAAAAAAGTLTFGGGAAAISRAIVMALRPLQTATVTRGIASTATSASVGAEIHGWRMGVNAL